MCICRISVNISSYHLASSICIYRKSIISSKSQKSFPNENKRMHVGMVWYIVIGASAQRAPHLWIIGASAASPTLVVKTENCLYVYMYIYICIYIYMFGTCVFRIYIHPAPFVRDAIFPHCL